MKPSGKNILGISAYYHDSAVVLLKDGEIICASQEERFTRIKHDESFPRNALKYALKEGGINSLNKLDAVVYYEKPLIKFERLLETYHAFAPKGLTSFVSSIPVWIKDKLFLKNKIRKELKELGIGEDIPLLFSDHHLSHAASAFYPSPFQDAAILTIDGVGEWNSVTIGKGISNNIKVLKYLEFPHSLGLLYSSFTYYCGFKVNSGEYKLMGLAPYGNKDSLEFKEIRKKIVDYLIDIREDGSFVLNMKYFEFATGLKMVKTKLWKDLFGFSPRREQDPLSQNYMNMALAVQDVTDKIIIQLARTAKKITGCDKLVMAGGVALNCVSNGHLMKAGIFKDIWIQPASGDSGGALGASLSVWYEHFENSRGVSTSGQDQMNNAFLGPQYTDKEILNVLKKYNANYFLYKEERKLINDVARLLNDGKVIGWFQGKMEFGPRALGNRSILGDARNEAMQKKMNLKIKYRESFRPFAPCLLEDDIEEYFNFKGKSPYMLFVSGINDKYRNPVPESYDDMDLYKKLYFKRSNLPAITHVDYSARLQTVSKESNSKLYYLLNRFKELSGFGILINTSFNVRGEPIVCSPEDAFSCFMKTEMDYLAINNFLLKKEDQNLEILGLLPKQTFAKD